MATQLESFHTGIRCDECNQRNFQGIRYKCNNCFDYDLCSSCYNEGRHIVSHTFIRISIPNTRGVFVPPRAATMENVLGIVHLRTNCDGCNTRGIRGIRYKCADCYDYDLCGICYSEGKHDLSHRFRKITTPRTLGVILSPRLSSSGNRQDILHSTVTCDSCTSYIRGIRFKCTECHNYDLCYSCYNNSNHNLTHSFRRIDRPNTPGVILPPRVSTGSNTEDNSHRGVNCDECGEVNIRGTRYKCNDCQDYVLCEHCYGLEEHLPWHSFTKMESPNSGGFRIYVPRRMIALENVLPDDAHIGIECDECDTVNICGIRYKCIDCNNYDLCSTCYEQGEHDLDHRFRKITSPNSPGILVPPRIATIGELLRDISLATLHKGIKCDGCGISDIDGLRYKCNDCPNYDLCDSCYQEGKHDLDHGFKIFDLPNSTGIDLEPRSASTVEEDVVHRHIVCDICHSGHIRGVRYKCRTCRDYDLCQNCYQHGEHNHHPFKKFETPDSSGIDLPPRLPSQANGRSGQTTETVQRVRFEQHVVDASNLNIQCLSLNDRQGRNNPTSTSPNTKPAGTSPNTAANPDRVQELEKKVAELEEINTCAICLEENRNVIFLCGHGTCSTCAEALDACHLCRKPIEKKIRIY